MREKIGIAVAVIAILGTVSAFGVWKGGIEQKLRGIERVVEQIEEINLQVRSLTVGQDWIIQELKGEFDR